MPPLRDPDRRGLELEPIRKPHLGCKRLRQPGPALRSVGRFGRQYASFARLGPGLARSLSPAKQVFG